LTQTESASHYKEMHPPEKAHKIRIWHAPQHESVVRFVAAAPAQAVRFVANLIKVLRL
jgi:hypothetical protein